MWWLVCEQIQKSSSNYNVNDDDNADNNDDDNNDGDDDDNEYDIAHK